MTTRPAAVGVVIPLRAFDDAKHRLSPRLDAAHRAALVRRLAAGVLDAAAPHPVVVVSSDAAVVTWARARGAHAVDDPGSLDAAAAAGVEWVASQGCPRAVVAHADLPLVRTFTAVATDAGRPIAVLVPDHRDDGTPVLSVPTHRPFPFAYGPDSFRRHVAEAHRAGLAVRVVREPTLRVDVDVPDDLERIPG